MLRSERRQLHARAAWGLEALADRPTEIAAILGHHYSLAGETERAVHYLEVAGDNAASAFANGEAVASYRRAIALIDELPRNHRLRASYVDLELKLARTLEYTGRFADARNALRRTLVAASPGDSVQLARLYTGLAGVETADHNYDAAIKALDAAEEWLGQDPEHQDQERVDLWLEIMVDRRANLYYWRNEPDKAAEVLTKARPVVEARGTALRKVSFYMNLAMQRARQTRYRVDDEILANARAAVAVAQDVHDERDVAWVPFSLGFLLLWHDDLVEARENLETSLRMTERTGDPVLRARCLCYLNVTALRRHDVEAVRSLSHEALAAAEAACYPEYVAAAKAAMAWVAWKDGRPDEVLQLAVAALDAWKATVVSYSWFWICLWPLIAVRLKAGQVAEAIGAAAELLVPTQQRLPDHLEALVRSAVSAWEAEQCDDAASMLAEALDLACRIGYA
jgi:eukaryotic-like serine/threonine-protein kinase